MDITPLGHSSFRIKGKLATVVTDPFKFPKRIEADIVTTSQKQEVAMIDGNPYMISGPGEYEVKGVGIVGIPVGTSTMYRIEIDGVAIVHLGALDRALSTTEVDELDGVHILMVPIAFPQAGTVISEIEPLIVIPMNYEKSQLEAFLKEIGKEAVPQVKLSITKDKLPAEMQVIVLE